MDLVLPSGKVIKNIPEGTSKEEIKAKLIAFGVATEDDFNRPVGDPQVADALIKHSQMKAKESREGDGGFIAGVKDFFTGEDRTTRDIERLPSIFESGAFADDPGKASKIAAMLQVTNDPNEMARIIQATYPEMRVQTNLDAKGNPYPVIISEDGQPFLIDKPGADALNVGQFGSQVALFAPASRALGLTGAAVKEGLTEAGIQTAQEMAGGEFDVADVALAAGLGAGGKGLENTLGSAWRYAVGDPQGSAATKEVLKAGQQFDVPVMTSDIAPPSDPFARLIQYTGETVPVVGTGGIRRAQQEARERAVQDYISLYQGGDYDTIITEIGKKSEQLKEMARPVYKEVIPKLDELSKDGVPVTNTQKAIGEAMEYFTDPGNEVGSEVAAMFQQIQDRAAKPQNFGNLKNNTTFFNNMINNVDSASRSQLPSNQKRILANIVDAMRKDRDEFAQASLDAADYSRLKRADAIWGDLSKELQTQKLKAVLDKGDVTPEVARNMLFSSNASDIDRLYKSLTDTGRSNARSVIIGDIVEQASKRQSGLTPNTFLAEVKKRRGTIDTFFKGDELNQINGLARLLEHTRRAQDVNAVMGTPTGQMSIGLGALGSWAIDPLIPASYGTIGASARVYESPMVRNILARMGTLPPGSTQFEMAARELQSALQTAAQAAKDPEGEAEQYSKDVREAFGGGQIQ